MSALFSLFLWIVGTLHLDVSVTFVKLQRYSTNNSMFSSFLDGTRICALPLSMARGRLHHRLRSAHVLLGPLPAVFLPPVWRHGDSDSLTLRDKEEGDSGLCKLDIYHGSAR